MMDYLKRIPKKLPAGQVVVHNHVQPAHPIGRNGFRVWRQEFDGTLEVCPCAGRLDWERTTLPARTPQHRGSSLHLLMMVNGVFRWFPTVDLSSGQSAFGAGKQGVFSSFGRITPTITNPWAFFLFPPLPQIDAHNLQSFLRAEERTAPQATQSAGRGNQGTPPAITRQLTGQMATHCEQVLHRVSSSNGISIDQSRNHGAQLLR